MSDMMHMNESFLLATGICGGFIGGVIFMAWLHTSPAKCARIVWDLTRQIIYEYEFYVNADCRLDESSKRIRLLSTEVLNDYLMACMTLRGPREKEKE